MEIPEKRQAHLAESKALLDEAMKEANLTDEQRGINRLDELADNLEKLAASKILAVANGRLGEFTEELTKSGIAEDTIEIETQIYKKEITDYLEQMLREKF